MKKISELHVHIHQKLTSDLTLVEPGHMTELQESCSRAEVERVAVFANSESVNDISDNGLSVGHFCCHSIGTETRHLRIIAQKGGQFSLLSRNEFAPLHLAAFNGDVEKAKIIIENIPKEALNQPGFGDVTPLHIAVIQVLTDCPGKKYHIF